MRINLPMECRVQVVQELRHRDRPDEPAGNYELCLQKVRYCHFSGEMQEGCRFIWRDTAGKQLASRGQARLPSLSIAEGLIRAARRAGWG